MYTSEGHPDTHLSLVDPFVTLREIIQCFLGCLGLKHMGPIEWMLRYQFIQNKADVELWFTTYWLFYGGLIRLEVRAISQTFKFVVDYEGKVFLKIFKNLINWVYPFLLVIDLKKIPIYVLFHR